ERDLAGRRRADRRARGDADVDARMARLPGPALAERRRDGPVHRPDEAAVAVLDRAGREVALRLLERGLDLGLLGLQGRQVALQLLWLGADRAQGPRLRRARAGRDPAWIARSRRDAAGRSRSAAAGGAPACPGAWPWPSRRPWRRAR